MYPLLALLVTMIKSDHGWTSEVKLQQKKRMNSGNIGGVIYFTRLTYRFPKQRRRSGRYRPGSIKWLVLNLELFSEVLDDELLDAAMTLVELADKRGITPRHSPGAFAGAMIRASKEWDTHRDAAPWFISEAARRYLPGNMYATRTGYAVRTTRHAYYLDQKSSHHTIASTINLPDPKSLRARGYFRAAERNESLSWISALCDILELGKHVGLLYATVECDTIPSNKEHLYPPWARVPGERAVWLWTPELRLLDRRVRLRWVSASLTSITKDLVLSEYAHWCLSILAGKPHVVVKPALLAAYGLLGVLAGKDIQKYSIHGREKPPRSLVTKLPLVGTCYVSTVKNTRVSRIQNVVARGVIEAETRTRSIELARVMENDLSIKVIQIYADGIIIDTQSVPLLPPTWRIAGELTNVRLPSPNTIVSDNMVRMPGVPGGRRRVSIV
jgi:hypothetical protein